MYDCFGWVCFLGVRNPDLNTAHWVVDPGLPGMRGGEDAAHTSWV